MRYLIDTNVFIQYLIDEYEITDDVQQIIGDYENVISVSSESIKEFIHLIQNEKIKPSKWKTLPRAFDVFDFIETHLGFSVKYVSREHLLTLANLPTVENHNDPSDRLIIAQAITEKIPLVSSDRKFPKYRKFGLDFIPNW
jgi:PIN domain nuclease of toxin-antitoxin system